jgi:peptidoglycan hydrolase CwlO-like protein
MMTEIQKLRAEVQDLVDMLRETSKERDYYERKVITLESLLGAANDEIDTLIEEVAILERERSR